MNMRIPKANFPVFFLFDPAFCRLSSKQFNSRKTFDMSWRCVYCRNVIVWKTQSSFGHAQNAHKQTTKTRYHLTHPKSLFTICCGFWCIWVYYAGQITKIIFYIDSSWWIYSRSPIQRKTIWSAVWPQTAFERNVTLFFWLFWPYCCSDCFGLYSWPPINLPQGTDRI